MTLSSSLLDALPLQGSHRATLHLTNNEAKLSFQYKHSAVYISSPSM